MTFEKFRKEQSRYISRKRLFIIGCAIITVFALFAEIGTGKYEITLQRAIELFLDHIMDMTPTNSQDAFDMDVVWDRVPTAIGGIGIGAILGCCGCVMQSSMKNPLADPYLTGIASGASFGATLYLLCDISVLSTDSYDLGMGANAFVFALIPATVMIFFSIIKKKMSTGGILLVGIAVMFFFNAITTLIKYYSDANSLADLYYWNVGSINPINWNNYLIVVAVAILCLITMQLFSRKLNILTLNDGNARTLGVDPRRTRMLLMILVSLFTSVAVCFTGTISFIGLVAPHVCRIFLGSDNRFLLPASAMAGAMILLLADCVAKNLTMAGLPAGVITSLIGGPVFLILLMKRKSSWGS